MQILSAYLTRRETSDNKFLWTDEISRQHIYSWAHPPQQMTLLDTQGGVRAGCHLKS